MLDKVALGHPQVLQSRGQGVASELWEQGLLPRGNSAKRSIFVSEAEEKVVSNSKEKGRVKS